MYYFLSPSGLSSFGWEPCNSSMPYYEGTKVDMIVPVLPEKKTEGSRARVTYDIFYSFKCQCKIVHIKGYCGITYWLLGGH